MTTKTGVFSEENLIRVNNGPPRVLLIGYFACAGLFATIAITVLFVYFFTNLFQDTSFAKYVFGLAFYLFVAALSFIWLGRIVYKIRKELLETQRPVLKKR